MGLPAHGTRNKEYVVHVKHVLADMGLAVHGTRNTEYEHGNDVLAETLRTTEFRGRQEKTNQESKHEKNVPIIQAQGLRFLLNKPPFVVEKRKPSIRHQRNSIGVGRGRRREKTRPSAHLMPRLMGSHTRVQQLHIEVLVYLCRYLICFPAKEERTKRRQ